MGPLQFALMACFVLQACLSFSASVISDNSGDENLPLPDQQYKKAVSIRARKNVSGQQLKQAAALLKAAAGLHVLGPGSELEDNLLLANTNLTEIYPGLHVANETHAGALKVLSFIYSQEGQGLPFNPRAAFELLRHAAATGDPGAQREWGLLLATGIQPPPENATHRLAFELGQRDWQKAFVNLYFAAIGNDSLAQLALGYRHAHGLGVPKSCPTAVLYYQAAAEKVVKAAQFPYSFPRVERVLLSSHNRRASLPSKEQEMLHFQWFADMGYAEAQRAVGRLLSQGGVEMAEKALRYFRQAAEADDPDAMAHLGHMYANGIGVKASNGTAIKWFRNGADRGNPSAHFGLGYMYLRGFGIPQDYTMAIKYLTAAAEQGHPEAWFHLGTMHLNGWGVTVSLQQAQSFFAMAAKAGHILGQYNLAMLYLKKRGQQNCQHALERLKTVAERGPWSMLLQEASDAFARGRHDWALLTYLKASEAGYELAQANAAWMLIHGYGIPANQSAKGYVEPGNKPSGAASTAIRSHKRALQQGNVDSMLAIGDAYYYGEGVTRDWNLAFQVYTWAARFRNVQANFNLGYMHEYGAGVPPDLALAKRYYDKALTYMPGATAPVRIALMSLSLHSWWQTLKPRLPQALHWPFDVLFTLKEPSKAMQPAGRYLPKASLDFSGLERFLDTIWDPSGLWLRNADLFEVCLLIILIGCLWMVWRRMSARSARRRQQAPPHPSPDRDLPPRNPPAAAPSAEAPPPEPQRPPSTAISSTDRSTGQVNDPTSHDSQESLPNAGPGQANQAEQQCRDGPPVSLSVPRVSHLKQSSHGSLLCGKFLEPFSEKQCTSVSVEESNKNFCRQACKQMAVTQLPCMTTVIL